MPKNSLQEKSYEPKKPYTRQPIHHKVTNEEDDEDSEEQNDSNLYPGSDLYPDLSEDLHKLQNKLNTKDTGKRGTKVEQSVINSGKRGTKFEQSVINSGKIGKTAKQMLMSENSDSSLHSSKLMYIIPLLILIIAVLGGGFFCMSPKKSSDKINVAELVARMQNHFQMKNPDMASKILKNALTKVVIDHPEPKAPAIFTVLANKGAEKTASDFSVHLAEALAPGSFVSINESLRWHNNPEKLKLDIDTKITSELDDGILNVVIVDRLNDIPIDAAIIFHGFCDHESAPFKRAVYVFIVHLGRHIPENLRGRDIDEIAQKSIRNIWVTATDDLVDSLITRITANVVSIL